MPCCSPTPTPGFTPTDLAAGCWSCPHSRPSPGWCRGGPKPISMADVLIGGVPCPLGRLPTAERPTFAGPWGRYRGVPWITRLRLAVSKGIDPDGFYGCGCHDSLKRWVESVAACRWEWPGRVWLFCGIGRGCPPFSLQVSDGA